MKNIFSILLVNQKNKISQLNKNDYRNTISKYMINTYFWYMYY